MGTQADRPGLPWLRLTAMVSGVMLLAVLAIGWTRAFWFDEVFTLGAAAIGRPLDWQVLLGDVHPPSFVLAVRALGALFGPDAHALRAVNLPGLMALAAGIVVAAPVLGRTRTLSLTILLCANLYTLNLMLDLRSYMLVLGFATLGHALLLVDRSRRMTVPLILTAAVLTSLHFFGAAIGLSILALSMAHHMRRRRLGRALVIAIAGAVLFTAFEIWAFGYSNVTDSMGGNLWIRNDIGPWLDFVAWQTPLFILAPVILIWTRRNGSKGRLAPEAGDMLLPPLMVLIAAIAISFHTPVISARNLVVCVPGFALAAVLMAPEALLDRLKHSILVPLVVLPLGLRYADTAIQPFQMIRWTVETATPIGCRGEPIYVAEPDVVDTYAQQIFLGEVVRPMRDFTEFNAPGPDCDVIAMGWHERGSVDDAIRFFAARGVETRAVLPPSERLAKHRRLSHGFVLVRAN